MDNAGTRSRTWRCLPLLLAALLPVIGCDSKPGANASSSASPSGNAMAHSSSLTVVRSATPKISEAAFMKALDQQLDKVFADLKGKKFRSRAQFSTEMGRLLAPKMMIRATSEAMGVSDVSVLSLFASDAEIGKRVSARIKERSKEVADRMLAEAPDSPMVVKEDCREAAAMGLALQQVAAGKRQPTLTDKRDAPLAAQLLIECKKLVDKHPEFKCYLDAADEAALDACK